MVCGVSSTEARILRRGPQRLHAFGDLDLPCNSFKLDDHRASPSETIGNAGIGQDLLKRLFDRIDAANARRGNPECLRSTQRCSIRIHFRTPPARRSAVRRRYRSGGPEATLGLIGWPVRRRCSRQNPAHAPDSSPGSDGRIRHQRSHGRPNGRRPASCSSVSSSYRGSLIFDPHP